MSDRQDRVVCRLWICRFPADPILGASAVRYIQADHCSKTTLLKCIAELNVYQHGEIELYGK
jgi:hypothetical protein